ncbi:hypothetical protein BJX96DRAFT_171123 [Aspergillus floccosus]
MVLGIITLATMVPTMIGLNEATQSTRDNEETRREAARRQRCNLVATCDIREGTQEQRQQVHNARVYLGPDGKLYITKHPPTEFVPFNGRFFQHPLFPPDNTAGLVTMSGENPPVLRWVFVDAQTHQVRWGGRQDSEGHLCGPYDWTRDEAQITLEGWEGWLAVRFPEDQAREHGVGGLWSGGKDIWRLYFDQNDDGADLPGDAQALEICLTRVAAES